MTAAAQHLLLVCTGNICRSPFMEHYLRAPLGARSGGAAVNLSSAGTHALAGYPVDPPMAARLAALGLSADGFRARQLTRPMVQAADLVLTADRGHRAAVLELEPGAHRRVFTLRQAVRLLAAEAFDPGLPLGELAAVMAGRRGRVPGGPDDDIADPIGRPPAEYEAVVGEMLLSLESLCRMLEG